MAMKALVLAALLFAAFLALAGCSSGPDRLVLDPPKRPLERLNGQPRWLPCMLGDALCTPRP